MPKALAQFRRKARDSTHAAGARAERRAVWHFRLRGYRIVTTNARAGGYEIDVVVRRGRQLVFCEAKMKAEATFGDPAEMVDEEKQRRLRRAAEAWLATHPELRELDVRFDVIGVAAGRLTRIADAF